MKAKLVLYKPQMQVWDFDLLPSRRSVMPCIYVCSVCQDIWARVMYEEYFSLLHTLGIPCPSCPVPTNHRDRFQSVPGSLIWSYPDCWEGLPDIDAEFAASLPRPVLLQELERHIKAYEEEHVSNPRPITIGQPFNTKQFRA